MEITDQILNDAKTLYNFHASFCRPPIRSDLILAAGSHDMRVPEQAAALYLQGYAPLVICSGGFGKITDGLFSEPEGVLNRKPAIRERTSLTAKSCSRNTNSP